VPRWENDYELAECVEHLEHAKYMLSVAEKGVAVVDQWTDISEPWSSRLPRFW
jgi:hypothetical protein